MNFYGPSKFVVLLAVAVLVAISACSTETDETAETDSQTDAGVDAEIPSVESIEHGEAQPADRPKIQVETARHSGVISDDPPLSADSFLSEEQASRLVSGTDLEALAITGQDISETQHSIRYSPVGAEHEIFGVGLQIWDLNEQDQTPDARLRELRDQFLNTDDADHSQAPDGAFTSNRAGIRNYAFSAQSHPYLFILSCDVDHCHDFDDLYELGAEIAAAH